MISMREQKNLNRKLAWAKYRMDMLERIEERQKVIKEISGRMEEKDLTEKEKQNLDSELQQLLLEVQELDQRSRICWDEPLEGDGRNQ